ncbi:MAG: PQQ-dependent sugar dehydrogenase [Verrucomicrobia bacterium]|nr:PQQ-dependent sugar dehydrogenase [Verrucomicrobiota bacterium]
MPTLPSHSVQFWSVTAALALALVLAPSLASVAIAAAPVRKVVLEAHCDNPMELAPLPDGRVLFIERFGSVRVWKPDTMSTVLAAKLSVHGHVNAMNAKETDRGGWESGLIGLALAPEFSRNGWIYLYYSPAGDAPENRLSRFTLTGDQLDLASEKIVLRVPVQREVCCHDAGSLAFDAAGNLFLSTGDNTNPFESDGFNPTDFRPERYMFDAARSAGNANDLRGKILRIHPEPDGRYTVPGGNLFPVGAAQTRPEIFVMGCRNPFRISVDKETGALTWGDVGPDARESRPERGPAGFDEINRTRTAGNFGWPFLIADNKPYRQYDFATRQSGDAQLREKPLNLSPRNTGPKELPPARGSWMAYPYSPSTRYPVVGSGGRAACAGPVYHYNPGLRSARKLPEAYDQCLFIYEWERHWIVSIKLNAAGEALQMERFAPEIALKRHIEMELGEDGALYMIEFGTGWENNKDSQVIRIEAIPQ